MEEITRRFHQAKQIYEEILKSIGGRQSMQWRGDIRGGHL